MNIYPKANLDITAYLIRMAYEGELGLDLPSLVQLHRSHVLSIPFEDLDIHLKRTIDLDLNAIFQKVVNNNRGGFCYELNYLFYALLSELGFDCKMVSARIYNEAGELGPEFDHMSIIVRLQEEYLLDVGYGDLFIEPLPIKDNITCQDWFKTYRIQKLDAENYLLSESRDGREFKNRYQFSTMARRIEEFYDQCQFKQYDPASYFVQHKICTLPTTTGRKTILDNRYILRSDKYRKEYPIYTESDFFQILKEDFQMDLFNQS